MVLIAHVLLQKAEIVEELALKLDQEHVLVVIDQDVEELLLDLCVSAQQQNDPELQDLEHEGVVVLRGFCNVLDDH